MSEQLRHKMIAFEATPPPAAWEAIAARLHDDQQYAPVAAKMNGFEVAPPPQTWNTVLAALEETTAEKTPVINGRRIIYRVAAAAVLVGFCIGGWMIINRHASKTELVKNTTGLVPAKAVNSNKVTGVNAPSNQNGSNPIVQSQQPTLRREKINPYTPARVVKENMRKYAMVKNFPVHNNMAFAKVEGPPLLDKNGEPIMDIDVLTTSSNYLVVAGPNGQLTRISSKFANVIRYLNSSNSDTEEYLDKVMKESGAWKKRFQEWRNKISQSSYIPSSVNFLDIVELKDLIQEKQ